MSTNNLQHQRKSFSLHREKLDLFSRSKSKDDLKDLSLA